MCQESTGRMASCFSSMPGSEIFSPFFTADIRTPFFCNDVLKKCALVGMDLIAEEEKRWKGCWSNFGLRRYVGDRLPKESNVEK